MRTASIRPSPTALARHRFLCLLALFLLYPSALLLVRGAVLYLGLDAAAMGILVAFLFASRRYRPFAVAVASIGGAALLTVVLAERSTSSPLALITRTAMLIAFLCTITIVAFVNVLKRERVTPDKVLGAICVYLLIGATWGLLYELVAISDPVAFRLPTPIVAGGAGQGSASPSLSLVDSLYFSYVTLTTMGIGDIAPTTVHARTLVWTEAVTGQIYIAVLIARLVSLQIVHSTANGGKRRTPRRRRRLP